MEERGITREEIERTLNEGWDAEDTRPGTSGKVLVLSYHKEWEGEFYEEKEISAYYKLKEGELILLTVKARYGKEFERKRETK